MARAVVMGVVILSAITWARLVKSPCNREDVLATDSKPDIASVTAGTTVAYPRMFFYANWLDLADEIARGTTICAVVRIQRASDHATEAHEEVLALSRHGTLSDSSTRLLQSSPGMLLTLGNAEFQIDIVVAATPGHQAIVSAVLVPFIVTNAATSPSRAEFASLRQQVGTYEMTAGIMFQPAPTSPWSAAWSRSRMAVVPPIAGSWRGAVSSRHGSVSGYLPQANRLAWAQALDGNAAVLAAGGQRLQLAEIQAQEADQVAMDACKQLLRPEWTPERGGRSRYDSLSRKEIESCQYRSPELIRVLNSRSRDWKLPKGCKNRAGPLLIPPVLASTTAQNRPTLPIVESEEALMAVVGEKEICSKIAIVIGSECRQASLHALANWPSSWLVVSTAGIESVDGNETETPVHPLRRLGVALCERRSPTDGRTAGERSLAGFGPRAGIWRTGALALAGSLDSESVDLVLLSSIEVPSIDVASSDFEANVEAMVEQLAKWWRTLREGGVLAGERFRDQSGVAGEFTVIGAAVTRFSSIHRVPFGLSHGGEARPTWFIRKR